MLYQIYAIMIKELKILYRDPSILAVLFVLPIVFVSVMTYAGVGNQGVRSAKILIVNEDHGNVAQNIILRLQHESGLIVQTQVGGIPITEKMAEDMLIKRGSNIAFVMVFPSNFSTALTAKKTDNVTVKFIADPATGGENLYPIERLAEIQVMNVDGILTATRASKDAIDMIITHNMALTHGELESIPQEFSHDMYGVETKIHSKVQFVQVPPKKFATAKPMTAENQNVPGYTLFGVFFIVQVIGNTFLREKADGTFSRLLVSPVSKTVLLIGKLVPFYLVNIVQVAFLFIFGALVFHIDLFISVWGLLAITLAASATANALGLLIAALVKSAEQMGPLSGVILVVMATFAGIFIPFFEMPVLMQKLSFFTPQAWALTGFQSILVHGQGLVAVLPNVGMLWLFAFIFYAFALLKFRFE